MARERLLAHLRRRHELAVIALCAPAGFGRSVLLEQALDDGPRRSGDIDLLYRCEADDATPDVLAGHLLEACRAPVGTPATAGGVADALRTVAADHQVALLVDQLEKCGPAGAVFWSELIERLPARTHLVLSGRPPVLPGLARLVTQGRAAVVDRHQLALSPTETKELLAVAPAEVVDPDPELLAWPAIASLLVQNQSALVAGYLREAVLDSLPPHLAKTLTGLAVTGGARADVLPTLIATLAPEAGDPAQVMRDLSGVPLLRASAAGCWPHAVWRAAGTGLIDATDQSRVVDATVRYHLDRNELVAGAEVALANRYVDGLRQTVRAALASQPPLVPLSELVAWSSSGLLPAGDPQGDWLAGVIGLQLGNVDGACAKDLERARLTFAAAGDGPAESRVLLFLGTAARARGDLAELARLQARAEVLAADGQPVAAGLAAVGRAVAAQLQGDPAAAVRILEGVAPGALSGDWEGQALMIRGTNLLLAGQLVAASEVLEAATYIGGDGSRAVAHDLLSTVRWYRGDEDGALQDEADAIALAARSGNPAALRLAQAGRACLLAARGESEAARRQLEELHQGPPGAPPDEAVALAGTADILIAVNNGEIERARARVHTIPAPARAARSSLWKAALVAALDPEAAKGDTSSPPGIRRAVHAGETGASFLAGGPPAGIDQRPFLPAIWCEQPLPRLTIKLLGDARIERDSVPVTHVAWSRSRVRELCLHLALVTDRDRNAVASDLWPGLDERSAARNLRVTLTHLMDVLDPPRQRMLVHPLFHDNGAFAFDRRSGLQIDVWDLEDHSRSVLTGGEHDDALLGHGRRLVRAGWGSLLGSGAAGEWAEPYHRRLSDLVYRAALRSGARAIRSRIGELAVDLANLALAVDPWSERAYTLLAEGHLVAGDADGARRAVLSATAALDELGVPAGVELLELIARLGLPAPGPI